MVKRWVGLVTLVLVAGACAKAAETPVSMGRFHAATGAGSTTTVPETSTTAGPTPEAAAALRKAVDATTATSSFSYTVHESAEGDAPTDARTGHGDVDLKTKQAHITYPNVDASDFAPSELIVTPTAIYMRIEDRSSSKPWIEFPMSTGSGLLDVMAGGSFGELANPLAELTQASSVRELPAAALGGADARRYEVRPPALLGMAAQTTITVWVGGRDLIERLEVHSEGSIGGEGPDVVGGIKRWFGRTTPTTAHDGDNDIIAFSMDTVLDLADYGKPVTIAIPPADQVQSIDDEFDDSDEAVNPPTPTGEWTVALAGDDPGLSWTVFTTTATNGGICMAVETDPKTEGFDVQRGEDETYTYGDHGDEPTYKGKHANCAYPADSEHSPDEIEIQAADADDQSGSGTHFLAGLTSVDVSELRLRVNGKTVPATTSKGVFFVSWTGSALPGNLTWKSGGELTSCDYADEDDEFVSELYC